MIFIKKLNELRIFVDCEKSIARELSDSLSFFMEGYQYMPSYRRGIFDGKMRLFDWKTQTTYRGLLFEIIRFLKKRGYEYVLDKNLKFDNFSEEIFDFSEFKHNYDPHDYQWDSFQDAIKFNSGLILSPTGCMDENTQIVVKINEIKKTISLSDLENLVSSGCKPEILTPSGYEKITDTYRKNSSGLLFTFDDNTHIKCSEFHLFWDDEWKSANQFYEGQILGNKRINSIEKVPIQDWIDFTVEANHSSYYHNGILHHNSGKSFIIFLLCAFFRKMFNMRILITVPTVSLVDQMFGDFQSYENDVKISKDCFLLKAGSDKNSKNPITISTWQSCFRESKDFFDKFDVYICDEAHQADAKSLTGIVNKLSDCKFRYGFTGTLDGSKSHELQLKGCFGNLIKHTSTKSLMDRGILSNLKINNIRLFHSHRKFDTYFEEIEYLINDLKRNEYLIDLCQGKKGNVLLLFNRIEHGKFIFEKLRNKQKTFFIDGSTPTDQRERVRHFCETHESVIIIASSGVFSQGINIKNLHHVILAHPFKSRIRNLQSIGRALRLHESKDIATLYDIGDDFGSNITIRHFNQRMEIYKEEGFKVEIYEHNL